MAVATALVRDHPGEPRHKALLASATVKTATATFDGPSQERGIELYEQAIALAEELYRADPKDLERQLGLSAAHHFLGVAFGETGKWPVAETHLREALRLDEIRAAAAPATAKTDVADDLLQLSQMLVRMKRYDEAATLLVRAVALRREVSTAQPKTSAASAFSALSSSLLDLPDQAGPRGRHAAVAAGVAPAAAPSLPPSAKAPRRRLQCLTLSLSGPVRRHV